MSRSKSISKSKSIGGPGSVSARVKLPSLEVYYLYKLGDAIIWMIMYGISNIEKPEDLLNSDGFKYMQRCLDEVRKMPRRLRGSPKLYKLAIELRNSLVERCELDEQFLRDVYRQGGIEMLRLSIAANLLNALKTILYVIADPYGDVLQ